MGNPRLVVIIHNKDLPVHFWGNTMNTICYTNKICVKLTRYLMSSGKKKKKSSRLGFYVSFEVSVVLVS